MHGSGPDRPWGRHRASPQLGHLRLDELLDLRDGRVGRFLHAALRPPSGDLDLLAGLLTDRPDGDLGLLAQLLDVPADLAVAAPRSWSVR